MNFGKRALAGDPRVDGPARPVSPGSSYALAGMVALVVVAIGVCLVFAVYIVATYLRPQASPAGDSRGRQARLHLPLHGAGSGRETGSFGRYLPATGGPEGAHGSSGAPTPAPFALRRHGGGGTEAPDDVQGQRGDPAYEEYLSTRQEHTRAIQEAASE